jgi:predicted nucleic acid-binding protein
MKEARSIIGKFKVLVSTFELNDKIVELALNDYSFKDFEDGIQYYTALESQCELILTRNMKDFKKSSIPVFSPKEYLTKRKAERKL